MGGPGHASLLDTVGLWQRGQIASTHERVSGTSADRNPHGGKGGFAAPARPHGSRGRGSPRQGAGPVLRLRSLSHSQVSAYESASGSFRNCAALSLVITTSFK